MKFSEPIREKSKINLIKDLLKGQEKIRELMLFNCGIVFALRISDLLCIKIKDLFDEELIPKNYFDIKEKKTGKTNRMTITPKLKDVMILYRDKYSDICSNPNNFVFFHKKLYPLGSKAITRVMGWYIISNIGKNVGLKGIAPHSLRKYWALMARLSGVPMELIQHKLNHSSLQNTQKYLGITNDEIMDVCNKLDL